MKKLIVLLALVVCATYALAQDKYKVYCSIMGYEKELKNGEVDVKIDYGQSNLQKNWLVDSEGNELKFKTMISVLNYMSKLGWCLEESTHSTNKITGNLISVWILSKDVNNDNEITNGFQTRLMFEQK